MSKNVAKIIGVILIINSFTLMNLSLKKMDVGLMIMPAIIIFIAGIYITFKNYD